MFEIAVSKPKLVLEVVFSELLGNFIWLADTDPAPTIPNWYPLMDYVAPPDILSFKRSSIVVSIAVILTLATVVSLTL